MNRLIYLDSLKGFSIILVILGHLYLAYDSDSFIFSFLTCFHMPIFIYVSGFLSSKKNQISFWKYIKKRTKLLLLPYVSFCLINVFIDGIDSLFSYFLGFTRGGLWFLPTIWLMNIIHYSILSVKLSKKSFFLIIIIEELILLILRCCLPENISNFLCIRHLSTYWLIFQMGYAFRIFNIEISDLLGFIATILFLTLWGSSLLYIGTNEVLRMIIRFSSTISVVYFFIRVANSPYNRLLTTFGKESLAIYILHYEFLRLIGPDFSSVFGNSILMRFILFMFISVFIACFCVSIKRCLSKNRYFSLFLFGT